MDNFAQAQVQTAKQGQNSSYYDISQLDKLRSAKPNDPEALKAAAKQFEAIFTQMLMTSMRKASEVLESDSPFNSESSKFYRDMHDKQMVSNMAANGGMGLAEVIIEQLSGTNPNFRPAAALRPDAQLNGLGRIHSASTINTPDDTDKAPQLNKEAQKAAETTKEQKTSLFDDPISFIKSLLPAAKKALAGTPLQPVMVVAQAALETGWGQKVINKKDGSSSFNLFGIKADARWEGEKTNVQTLEFKDGVAKKENAFFRAYHSFEDSVKDYANFLSSDKRYAKALENADNPAKYFESLQSAGYATDPEYAKKIVDILNSDYFADVKE
ncbi:MAG: flagellar assembly peptidoglycan hydrolase FlgJ [Algicola sp.]|nr:flagellar assembly peptidoglycan hydrolase FlgJ [Algicola sp.]